ncbi:MAG TPA: hypothetical protein VGR37_24260 [Longimicrobiaceae bacterium]|nr:hypothetical protein [Longimicrobiaceae bacterium]
MAALEREIHERLAVLGPEQQRQVLEYARALSEAPRRGVPGKALLRFSGTIPADDLRAIARAVEEDCERVDPNGW